MDILYGISGVGLGHAVRASTVIAHVKKEVHVVTSGMGYEFLKGRVKNIYKIQGFQLIYHKNKLRFLSTTFANLIALPAMVHSFFSLFHIVRKNRPKMIITDFDTLTPLLGLIFCIPVLSIDNIHVLTHTKAPDLPGKGKMASLLITRLKTLGCKKYFIPTFFKAFPKSNNVRIFPPLVREAIVRMKPKKGKHVLVYQRAENLSSLEVFHAFPEETFVVYGLPAKKVKNVFCKPISHETFLQDLQSAKAVITAGGFSLITEALALKKPVLSIPIKNHYEQSVNASHVEVAGYGKKAVALSKELLGEFLKDIPSYKTALASYERQGNRKLFAAVDKVVKQWTS